MNDVEMPEDQQKILQTWGQCAVRRGFDLSKLQQSSDNPFQLDRLIAYIDAGCPVGFTFPYTFAHHSRTVCQALAFTDTCSETMPPVPHGRSVVWYGGWGIEELEERDMVVNNLRKELTGCRVPAGYYDIRIPVPGTNGMTHDEQLVELRKQCPGYGELPLAVGVTILAVHFAVTGNDLLNGKFCFCAETLPDGRRPVLYVQKKRVQIYYGQDKNRSSNLFAAAALKA